MKDKKQKTICCMEALKILTPREIEVIEHIARGQTTKQIASELGIAPSTVKGHRRNICAELELRGPNALIRWSMENKGQLL